MMRVLKQYRDGARSRGLSFELDIDEFKTLTSSKCHYCGADPSSIHYGDSRLNPWFAYTYNGIDRKNNKIGYTVNNCLPCCTACNRAKLQTSYDEFIVYLEKVANYRLLLRQS